LHRTHVRAECPVRAFLSRSATSGGFDMLCYLPVRKPACATV
jgi:hypothetical protein